MLADDIREIEQDFTKQCINCSFKGMSETNGWCYMFQKPPEINCEKRQTNHQEADAINALYFSFPTLEEDN